MHKKLLLVLASLHLFVNGYALNPKPARVNRQAIIALTNDYILLLQTAINQRSGDFLVTVGDCFSDHTVNDHVYDLDDTADKMMVASYLLEAKNNLKITEFDALTEDMELLPCTYFNPSTSKNYAYVKLPKIMIRQGNKKQSYNHYLSIDITNSRYFIDAVYGDDAITAQKFIAPCMRKQLDAEKQRQLAVQIETKFEVVTNFYKETKYLEALVVIDDILAINPAHQPSIDAKEAVLDLVSLTTIENNIENALSNKQLSKAKNTLRIVTNYNLATLDAISLWQAKIESKAKDMKQQANFDRAESYFFNNMFQQALPIYNKLKASGFYNPNLEARTKTCLEADPLYIQNKIKEAYGAVIASKKNANNTFATYYKFQNSGYLNGSNYRFMCQMMLSKGNKKLLKELNIPPSQAKNLAIKYFYSAKDKGKSMQDIEFMVFTQNFNKN